MSPLFSSTPSVCSSSPSPSLPFFFKVKSDPFKKEAAKKEVEEKMTSSKSSEKRTSTGSKTSKWVEMENQQLRERPLWEHTVTLPCFTERCPRKTRRSRTSLQRKTAKKRLRNPTPKARKQRRPRPRRRRTRRSTYVRLGVLHVVLLVV